MLNSPLRRHEDLVRRVEELKRALGDLIRSIDIWEEEIQKIIGRQPRAFPELDRAKKVLGE